MHTGESARAERRERVAGLLRGMGTGLIERDEPARLLLLAALAGEHVLLVGPPGTAKSELARRLRRCLSDGGYFERLLTRFSVPEELFGPLSIQGLERDEYRRLTDGYLPTASVAFLDEIFNANSAILNALLTLLNEREFDNGTTRVVTPLACVVAASNQTPEGPELEALHDRFLLRCLVQPVSPRGFDALLDPDPALSSSALPGHAFSLDELAQLRRDASGVVLPTSVRGVLAGLRQALRDKAVYVSDRRWRKIAALLRLAAHCDGRTVVGLVDCWLALPCLWSRPEQIAVVEALLQTMLDAALLEEPRRFQSMAEALEQQVIRENDRQEQLCDDDGRPLFVDEHGLFTTDSHLIVQRANAQGDLLFSPPVGFPRANVWRAFSSHELWDGWFQHRPDAVTQFENWINNPAHRVVDKTLREPLKGAAVYAVDHVTARRNQLRELLVDMRSFQHAIAALRGQGDEPLWVDPARHRAVHGRLDEAGQRIAAASEQLARALDGVNRLTTRAP